MFNVKKSMCYRSLEKKPPITFVIYDEAKSEEIKQDIQTEPFVKINGKSMEPTIEHNDFCLCSPQLNYEVNDIIAFYVPAPDNKIELIAHRIIIKNNTLFRTKGDGNPYADNQMINKEQIFCKIPEKKLFDKFQFAIKEKMSIFSLFG